MINQEIVKIFYGFASFFEMEGVAFKPYAYRKAALALEALEEDVGEIYKRGGLKVLQEIPGVGRGLALRIEEYLKTGKIKDYQDFKKKLPLKLDELIAVEGMGPRKAKVLYERLKIKNLKDLEKAAKAHKIAPLFGFGEKTEKNILQGIAFVKRSKGRFLLGNIAPTINEVIAKLKSLKEVDGISPAGSFRRKRETVGDVDILIISKKPEKVMDFFVSFPEVVKIWGKGKTKASIRMKQGFDIDLRVVPKKSYGSALQYFTGSKDHNIILRRVAIDKGLKLNEYGLFRGPKMIASSTEEEIYKALGLSYIEPELRENTGEIEMAKMGKLPEIIDYKDIKGDLHTQTNWNGGHHSIEDMAKEAQKMGYEYIGISDHTKFLRIEHGLDEKKLLKQHKYFNNLNKKLKNFRILHGCESNIMPDGSIDIKDEVLAQLDYVIAGVHSQMKMDRVRMTERIIRAMRNPNVDIISHPTGRLIQKRDEYLIDLDKIIKVAKETRTILEINSFPERLDLNDRNIRKAKEIGVKMIINTDAHHKDHLRLMEYGISQARRR